MSSREDRLRERLVEALSAHESQLSRRLDALEAWVGSTWVGAGGDSRLRSAPVPAEERLASLERQLAGLTDTVKRQSEGLASQRAVQRLMKVRLESFVEAMGQGGEAAVPDGPVPIESVTFEGLRGLGLSVTQAVRVLNRRDEGRLRDAADVDRIPGLPAELRERLKSVLTGPS